MEQGYKFLLDLIRDKPNCELIAYKGVAQPVNLLTNLALIVAGIWSWNYYQKNKLYDEGLVRLYIYAIFISGIGSSIHHFFASDVSLWADGIPILWLITLVIVLLGKRIFDWTPIKSILLVVTGLLLALLLASTLGKLIDSTWLLFAPVLGILWPLIRKAYSRFGRRAVLLGRAAAAFVGAYWALLLDGILCPFTKIVGTHFVWHILIGVAIFRLAQFFVLTQRPIRT